MTAATVLSQTITVPTSPSGFGAVTIDEDLAHQYGIDPQLRVSRRMAGASPLLDFKLQRVCDASRRAFPSVRLDDRDSTRSFHESSTGFGQLVFTIKPDEASTIVIF